MRAYFHFKIVKVLHRIARILFIKKQELGTLVTGRWCKVSVAFPEFINRSKTCFSNSNGSRARLCAAASRSRRRLMLRQAYSRCVCLSLEWKSTRGCNGARFITCRDETSRRRSSAERELSFLSSGEKGYSSEGFPRLPSQSQIVIAGAGTVANSVAYHLVLNGWNDVLVLEQNT